jgi:hypothetical protein
VHPGASDGTGPYVPDDGIGAYRRALYQQLAAAMGRLVVAHREPLVARAPAATSHQSTGIPAVYEVRAPAHLTRRLPWLVPAVGASLAILWATRGSGAVASEVLGRAAPAPTAVALLAVRNGIWAARLRVGPDGIRERREGRPRQTLLPWRHVRAAQLRKVGSSPLWLVVTLTVPPEQGERLTRAA